MCVQKTMDRVEGKLSREKVLNNWQSRTYHRYKIHSILLHSTPCAFNSMNQKTSRRYKDEGKYNLVQIGFAVQFTSQVLFINL